jgi:hypothetical protein
MAHILGPYLMGLIHVKPKGGRCVVCLRGLYWCHGEVFLTPSRYLDVSCGTEEIRSGNFGDIEIYS